MGRLREWEQERRQPEAEAPARALLLVIAYSPGMVEQVLAQAKALP